MSSFSPDAYPYMTTQYPMHHSLETLCISLICANEVGVLYDELNALHCHVPSTSLLSAHILFLLICTTQYTPYLRQDAIYDISLSVPLLYMVGETFVVQESMPHLCNSQHCGSLFYPQIILVFIGNRSTLCVCLTRSLSCACLGGIF